MDVRTVQLVLRPQAGLYEKAPQEGDPKNLNPKRCKIPVRVQWQRIVKKIQEKKARRRENIKIKKYTFEMFEGFHRNPANHQDGDGGAQPHTTPIGLRDSRTALGADAARRGSAPVCAGGPRRTDKEGGGGGAVDDH